MKILVCGGRDFDNWQLVKETLAPYQNIEDLVIIEGEAKGADFLARVWAVWACKRYQAFPADWKLGLHAGFKRNVEMLEQKPDLVIAFPGGKGTAHMVKIAKEAGIPVKEIL